MIYQIHGGLLARHSDRLAGSVARGFAEAQSGEIVLDEEDQELFNYFARFVYTKTPPSPRASPTKIGSSLRASTR